jgi:hypothetical protein
LTRRFTQRRRGNHTRFAGSCHRHIDVMDHRAPFPRFCAVVCCQTDTGHEREHEDHGQTVGSQQDGFLLAPKLSCAWRQVLSYPRALQIAAVCAPRLGVRHASRTGAEKAAVVAGLQQQFEYPVTIHIADDRMGERVKPRLSEEPEQFSVTMQNV